VILLATIALLCGAGLVPLSLLEHRQRALLLPALPTLGAVTLVVALHVPAPFLATRVGLILVVVASLTLLIARGRRTPWWRMRMPSWRLLVIAAVVGLAPLCVVVLPSVRAGSPRLVQPTSSNDAFSYVTVASWLTDHPALDRPVRDEDPPAWGYVTTHLRIGLRLGDGLLHAAVGATTGHDPATTWYTAMTVWVLLLPGSYLVAGRLLGLRVVTGLLAGLFVGLSAPLATQVFNQNSASVLGIALAPLAVALLVAATTDSDSCRPPPWLAGLAIAALVGTYTEYLPLIAPGLLLFYALRGPSRWKSTLSGLSAVLAWSLLFGPFIWFNAARSLLFTSGVAAGGPASAYLDVPAWTALSRFLGVSPAIGAAPSSLSAIILALALAAGVSAAVLLSPQRRLWFSLLLASGALVLALSTFHRFPYGQSRAVDISQPLWILAALAGFEALVVVVVENRRLLRSAGTAGLAGLWLLSLIFVRANFRTASEVAFSDAVKVRSVDGDFFRAVAWLERVSGPSGTNGMVVESGYFPQLWMTYLTRQQQGMTFPFLYPDYLGVGSRSDGKLRRYALVGRDVLLDADPNVVVGENKRFRYLDLAQGNAVMAVPTKNFYEGEPPTRAGAPRWMADDGELLVLRNDVDAKLRLQGSSLGEVAPLTLEVILSGGVTLARSDVAAQTTELALDLPPQQTVRLTLHNLKPARAPERGGDTRSLSFFLRGVTGD
jgi:hypothetical protein